MGRETRAWMPKSQSKADIRTAYGQRKQTKGARKSVPNRHKSNKMADKNNKIRGQFI